MKDVNDNVPVFERQQYFASVREGAAVGTQVVRVAAADRDGDPIAYALLPDKHAAAFSIDASSGSIRVAHVIDAETLDSLRLELHVTATDGPSTPGSPESLTHTATATVLVDVVDVDEFAPSISIGSDGDDGDRGPRVGSLKPIRVPASAPTGTPVTNITLSDKDKAPTGLKCEINDTVNFKLDKKQTQNLTGKLLFTVKFAIFTE